MTGSKDKRPVRKGRPGPKSTESKSVPNIPANTPAQAGNTEPATQAPPPGLDEARHAAAQRTAHQANVLREGAFSALLATALNLDKHFDTGAYRVYLAGVMRDLGDPKDPIERMLIEQLCLAHFRVAQLHGAAGQANGLEGMKILNSVAARMLGEMRRTALGLKAYRTSAAPAGQAKTQLKLLKAAQ